MVDQLVSIVQHVLETNAEEALEHLAHVKMDQIVLNFIKLVLPSIYLGDRVI